MSFVNNSSSTGIQFIGAASESARIGRSSPLEPVSAPGVIPSARDQMAQTAGQEGHARPVSFLDGSPRLLQFRQYLAAGQWDQLLSLLESLSSREIADLALSVEEINQLADGLGKGSLTASLPLVGSYTDQERQAVQRLIKACTHLSVNQRVYLLKENVGPGAVLAFVQTATPAELKKLSVANRQMVLSVLDPGSSIWGTLSGATTEVVNRRVIGNERIEDRLAGQILKSAANEQELRDLLLKLNQFSRDDAVYHYVMSLSAQELSALSDGMKKDLLQHLVDTGIQLPLIHIDLNSIANLDETLSMTFKEHVQAARLLYTALTPQAQHSQEVRTLVSRSDELMRELSQLEAAIRQDQQTGKMTQQKISAYREQILALQSKYPEHPQIREKTQQLLGTLSSLQQALRQTAGTQVTVLRDMEQVRGTVKRLGAAVQASRQALDRLKLSLPRVQQQLKEREEKLLKQYEALIQVRKRFEGLEPRYAQVLQEMEAALQNPRAQKGKLAQLEAMHQQLKQIEKQLGHQNQSFQGVMAEIHAVTEALEADQAGYNQQVEVLNQQRHELLEHQSRLERNLGQYQSQVSRLEQGLNVARQQFQALKDAGAAPADLSTLEKEIQGISVEVSAHRTRLQQTEKDYRQYLVPEAEKLIQQQGVQQQEHQTMQSQLAAAQASTRVINSMAKTMGEVIPSLQNAVSQVLEQSKSFLADLQKRLSSGEAISSQQIQTFKEQLAAQIQVLEMHRQDSPEAVASQLAALKELEATLSRLEDQLGASARVESQLNSSLEALQARQLGIEAELKGAEEVIALSRQSLSRHEAKMLVIQQRIATFQADLKKYADDIQGLESALAARQQEALRAQEQYGKGQISGTDLIQLLQANESERKRLQAHLDSLTQEMGRLQGQLEGSIETLQAHQSTLNAEQLKLQQAVTRAEQLRTEWHQLRDQNLQQLERARNVLMNLKSAASQYPSVGIKAQELEQLLSRLEQKNQAIEQRVQASNQVLINVLPLQRQIEQTQQELKSLNQRFSELKLEQLAPAQQVVDRLNREFLLLQEKATAVKADRERLEYLLRHADKPFAIPEMQARIEQLIRREGIAAAEVQNLLTLKTDLEQMRRVRQEGDMVLQAHQGLRRRHLERYSAAQQAMLDVRSQVEQLKVGIVQAEAELQASQREMLDTQRQMLEFRKTLGITSSDYLGALSRYEVLLKRGGRLSVAEVQELEALEQQLSGIEQQLLNTSTALRDRLGSLNLLRSRMNQQMDQLREKSQRLHVLRNELSHSLDSLKSSRTQLLSQRDQLLQQQKHLNTRLQEVEVLLQRYPGTAELLEMRQQLRLELAETDQLLHQYRDELSQTDSDIIDSEKLIHNIDQVLDSCRNIQEKLVLLVVHLDDVIQEAEQLSNALTELQTLLEQQQKALQRTQELVGTEAKPGGAVAYPVRSETGGGAQNAREQRAPLQLVRKVLEEGLSVWGRQHQRREAQREKNHQEQRDKWLAVLEQQLVSARQYDRDWKEKNQQMAQLEQLVDLMIARMATTGESVGSIVNILGVQQPGQNPDRGA